MNRKRRIILIIVFAVLIFIAVMAAASGAFVSTDYTDGSYEISNLDMRIGVSKDHSYEVEVFISVDIPETLPQIAFAVPGGSLRIEDLTVEGKAARAIRKDEVKHVVIKDPQLLAAGHHRYRINYRLLDSADENDGKDVFSFDVIPEGWKQPVYKLHALMWFPYGFPLEDIVPCADESKVSKLTIKREPQSRSFTLGIRGIPEDYSVRVEADLPDGFWD